MSVREKKCAHGFYALEACHDCLLERIAELEAELAEYRSAEHVYGKYFAERAEKAEAEVERLRVKLQEIRAWVDVETVSR